MSPSPSRHSIRFAVIGLVAAGLVTLAFAGSGWPARAMAASALLALAGFAWHAAHRLTASHRALAEQQSKLRAALTGIEDAVVLVGPDGRTLIRNPAAAALLGTPGDGAWHRDVRLRRRDGRTVIPDELTGHHPRDAGDDLEVVRADGGVRRMSVAGQPITGDGHVEGTVWVLRDVTERRAIEERLRHAERLDAVGQLAGGVAHDFNNLLAAITGHTELLARKVASDPQLARRCDRILTAAKRAGRLTQSLLAFTRRSPDERTAFDLRRLVHETVELVEETFDPRIQLHLVNQGPPLIIRGAATQLQTAIMNLLLNARDALPAGGKIQVTVASARIEGSLYQGQAHGLNEGTYAEITVRDDGTGIPPKVLPRIFEAFFTTKPAGKGTGLGLPSAWAIVHDHTGTLLVDSTVGQGSTFRVLLPLSTRQDEESSTMTLGQIAPLRPLRILVADDEELVREATCEVLRNDGHEVEAVADGQAAITAARCGLHDLVILDLVMPGVDGFTALEAIHREHPRTALIACTGYTGERERLDRARADGSVSAVVLKPFRHDELRRAIARAIERAASTR